MDWKLPNKLKSARINGMQSILHENVAALNKPIKQINPMPLFVYFFLRIFGRKAIKTRIRKIALDSIEMRNIKEIFWWKIYQRDSLKEVN